MAKKTTLKHELPCGTIATRTTARAYTHVVMVRQDIAAERARLDVLRIEEAMRGFAYFSDLVKLGVGGRYRFDNGHYSQPLTQAQVDEAVAGIAGCVSAQDYAEKCRAERLAKHDATYGDAEVSDWYVLSWSSRADLAEKEAARCRSHWYYREAVAQAINNGVREA